MKEINEAMLKVFSEIDSIPKNKENPFYHSRYADLDIIVSTIKPILIKHEIWFRQISHPSDKSAIIETIIHHSSGQIIECGAVSVPFVKNDPQSYGSAFTYARRYSLSAAFGLVTDDDDDGNNAKKQNGNKQPEKQKGNFEALMTYLNTEMTPDKFRNAKKMIAQKEWTEDETSKIEIRIKEIQESFSVPI